MQDLAFLLVLSGILLVYCEAIWMGRIVFGVAGTILILYGLTRPWRMAVSPLGLGLIVASVIGFILEARLRTTITAGVLATLCLISGAWNIGVSPIVVVPSSVVFGAVTIWLLWVAKRARHNKEADLQI